MTIRSAGACAALGFAAMFSIAAPAHALTMQECSAKYSAAKTAGTLNGQKWNDFRKAECGSEAGSDASSSRSPEGSRSCAEGGQDHSRTGPGHAGWRRQVSERGRSEIFQGNRRQSADAHLRRSVQCQQDE